MEERAKDVSYINTTGKPIVIYVSLANNNAFAYFYLNGICIGYINAYGAYTGGMLIVPNGASYHVTGGGSLQIWMELR